MYESTVKAFGIFGKDKWFKDTTLGDNISLEISRYLAI